MKKSKTISLIFILFIGTSMSCFLYLPKSITTVLNRIEYPFTVGEILATQPIEENVTVVIYTNKEKNSELQNVVVRKKSIFYSVIDTNGSLTIEKPKKLKSGELRTRVLISWYDKTDQYIVIAVAYDEDVASVAFLNEKLTALNVNGYHLFYGSGKGEYKEYELFDKDGNRLEHIKE